MDRLNNSLLHKLSADVVTPDYDRSKVDIGIVHLGPGAFHRSHQAYFTELALAYGGNWAICGISLNSTSIKDALVPQDCLYTLAIQEQQNKYQVIGALKEVLHLAQDRAKVMSRLVNPNTKIVTLTVTEKGYCLDSNGNLDLDNPSIQNDMADADNPSSAIGLLLRGIEARRAKNSTPLLVISCDNVTENGSKLRSAVLQLASAINAEELADYIRANMHFPCTMVDSITPATDAQLQNAISDKLHYVDAWPVKREAFAQWVIESTPATDLPAWDKAGVTFTPDIEGFENAKLRLLNLPHSCLAYMGSLLGLKTVYEAISHPSLEKFVKSLVNKEVIPSCEAPEGLNLQEYHNDILNRFRNPSIKHLLEQIAHDGSQKLQMRLIPIVKLNLAQGRPIHKLCLVMAAWLKFIISKDEGDDTLVDPIAETLKNLVSKHQGNHREILQGFLAIESLFDQDLTGNEAFQASMSKAFETIMTLGIASAIERP